MGSLPSLPFLIPAGQGRDHSLCGLEPYSDVLNHSRPYGFLVLNLQYVPSHLSEARYWSLSHWGCTNWIAWIQGIFLRDKFSKLNGVDVFFSYMLYQIASLTAPPFAFCLGFLLTKKSTMQNGIKRSHFLMAHQVNPAICPRQALKMRSAAWWLIHRSARKHLRCCPYGQPHTKSANTCWFHPGVPGTGDDTGLVPVLWGFWSTRKGPEIVALIETRRNKICCRVQLECWEFVIFSLNWKAIDSWLDHWNQKWG